MSDWIIFLSLTIVCMILQGFFAMCEMAAVSFNRVRLQYYVARNIRPAKWLNHLLNRPSRLFGTTLIGVNAFLQIGSEASRRFYESIGLSPDLAPLTQVILVLIFGELAPMFAARKHPEHVSMLGINIIYVVSKILAPIIFLVDGISSLIYLLVGRKKDSAYYLSKEEVQRAFEERESFKGDLNMVVGNIFSLKLKKVKQVMMPLDQAHPISSESSLKQIRNLLSVNYSSYIPIFHRFAHNIVAAIHPRDLLKAKEDQKVMEFSTPPWFITEDDSVLEILKQFRRNNQNAAIVLDHSGHAIGIVSLHLIVDLLFNQSSEEFEEEESNGFKGFMERTLPGTMTVKDFNRQFGANLEHSEEEDLSDMINRILKHHPSKGEIVRIENFEFTVIEPSLLGSKLILARSLN